MNRAFVIFVIIASFALEAYCGPPESANVTVKDYCIKETGISKEKVKKMEDESLEEPDEDAYCYLHCIFVSMNLIDDKGKLDVNRILEEFEDFDGECLKKVPKIMECTDMAALDDCDE